MTPSFIRLPNSPLQNLYNYIKSLLFYLFLFFIMACDAQKKDIEKKSIADKVVSYYNNKQYDSVFYAFSPEMKGALPLQSTRDFFEGMYKDGGMLKKIELIENKENFDKYRADFDKGIYWLNISQNKEGKIAGLYITEYDGPGLQPLLLRNTTKLSLPFNGEWFVFWGGDTKEQNYHVVSRSQKNAFDFVMVNEKGISYKTTGKKNEDYYAFGQPLMAPCDAIVVLVIDGIKDNTPGESDMNNITGNTVVLKTDANEYILFAHFKLNSIKVKTGDTVKKGQLLGLCGNSGHSSEPHLHYHVQDRENMIGSIGVKCHFENILVNGSAKTDYSPVRGERIKSVN